MVKLAVYTAIAVSAVVGTGKAQTVFPVRAIQVSLATMAHTEQLPYLVLEMPVIEIPTNMSLAEAYVEFYMDASSALSAEDAAANSVTLEAYPYSGTTNGKLDVSSLGHSSMKRTVKVGSERHIHLRITDFIQHVLAEPGSDRRLIVGSVTGKRSGRFDAKTLPGTAETKAALVVYFTRLGSAPAKQPAGE